MGSMGMSEAILPRPQGLNSRGVDVSLLLARRAGPVSSYAFPQTRLGKSGPDGAVPPHRKQGPLDNGTPALVCSCPTDVGVRYHPGRTSHDRRTERALSRAAERQL